MHETRLQTRWTDFDTLGHITHAAYPVYFDEARDAFLSADRPDEPDLRAGSLGPGGELSATSRSVLVAWDGDARGASPISDAQRAKRV